MVLKKSKIKIPYIRLNFRIVRQSDARWCERRGVNCYPAPLVLQIILISVKLNEGTDSDILMFFTAECLNRYLLVLSYQSYKNSRYLPDQSLTPAIITIRCTTTSLDREMLHQRYDNNYSTF